MIDPVYIVAVGARTPVGLTAESSAAAVRAGISLVREHPFIISTRGERRRSASDAQLESTLLGWRRLATLGASALREAIGKLHLAQPDLRGLRLLLAVPEMRPGFGDAEVRKVLAALSEAISRVASDARIEITGRGHAGALRGMQIAEQLLSSGQCDLCVVGGVDSYFDPDTLDWLEAERRLSGEGIRAGFVPGEGAGFTVLARASVTRAMRLSALATLQGVGTSTEARLLNGDVEVLGHGLAEAITFATAGLREPQEAIDTIYCDINGERYRSDEWAFAVLRTQIRLKDSGYEAPADCWGDVGAASGALCCVLAVQSWVRGYARGPRALVWASSDEGLRGAAVLEQQRN
jgi:3-oxoacyl-[acyl-carrier-protein] synthase-1